MVLFDLLEENAGAASTRELGGIAYRKVDQGNSSELQAALALVAKDFARLDVVIGNAALGAGSRLLDLTASQWEEALRVNLVGCAMLAQAAVKQMLGQAPDAEGFRGKVFVYQFLGWDLRFARRNSILREQGRSRPSGSFGGTGIRGERNSTEYAVAPGRLDAGLTRKAFERDPSLRPKFLASVPVEQFGTPEHIADAFVFLCSRDSNYVTGQILFVDGGCSLTKKE